MSPFRKVALGAERLVDPAARRRVAKRAADQLVRVAVAHKDLAGTGRETLGRGDFRINERRAAVRSLLSSFDPQFRRPKSIAALGPHLQEDLTWLRSADFRDYAAEPTPGRFDWAANDYIQGPALEQEFQKRIEEGRVQAQALGAGTQRFFDVSRRNSLLGLHFLAEPGARASALADALLQFRGRVDAANAGRENATRIDREGPLHAAEHRLLLSEAHFAQDPDSLRDYALLRLAIASHPVSEVNGVYLARNAVSGIFNDGNPNRSRKDTTHPTAWVKSEAPPGAVHSPYVAIHHNFSRDTSRDIEAFVREWMFPVGPQPTRAPNFLRLVDALVQARAGNAAQARALAQGIEPIGSVVRATADAHLADALLGFLRQSSVKDLGAQAEQNLKLAAHIYRVVCQQAPTVDLLEKELFHAGRAWPEVADVVLAMRQDDSLGTLVSLGRARESLRGAVFESDKGFERHRLMMFDAQLERLANEELGRSVDRVGTLQTDAQKTEALVALQTALRSALASGLGAIRSSTDEAAAKGEALDAVLADVDAMLTHGSAESDAYREVMFRALVASKRAVQNIRAFFDERKAAVASGGAELDPLFDDQFTKQTALHYAIALGQKGMMADLGEVVSARHLANIQGMKVLHSVGPVFFPQVVLADNAEDLAKLSPAPSRHALVVLKHADETRLVMKGGLWVDTRDEPGGGSHLVHLLMNNGIPALALPELATRYGAFLEAAQKEGGVYFDDSHGQVQMMTAGLARERGLLDAASEKTLLPGNNRQVLYLRTAPGATAPEVMAQHDAITNPNRPTRRVELYVPQEHINGKGRSSLSFKELAELGLLGRHLAGEKGLILALLRQQPGLGGQVPDGSVVTTGKVQHLLRVCGLADIWSKPWRADPVVGAVTDANFTSSAFYTDAAYRARVREDILQLTHNRLTQLLIPTGSDGKQRLSPMGQALYAELVRNPSLAQSDSWIARSSFTGEDRPGKSGAGMYVSVPALRDPVARLRGIIEVIESAWHAEPVENNVAEEINLQHIMPAVVIQDCIEDAKTSGVAVSHHAETGARGYVSYQVKPGYGGGVEGGRVQQGVVGPHQEHQLRQAYPGVDGGLLTPAQLDQLRDAVLKIEGFFDDVAEKGKHHTVDVEFVHSPNGLHIVQARVLLTGP